MALVLILIIGSSYFLVTKFNANLILARQSEETGLALSAAKDALIGYAISFPEIDTKTGTDTIDGPGYLPCPDLTNNGVAGGSCSLKGTNTPVTSIGRFPYATFESEDLRDNHGERFWYVISDNFRNNPKMIPLNSETAGDSSGDLTVNGYTNIVAVIFAADAPENTQNRTAANENSYAHYIEATFTDSDSDLYIDTITTGDTDRYILLTRDELMKVVEKRVLGEVTQVLKTYRDDADWNSDNIYPWLSAFADPSTSLFKGVINVREGHLGVHWMNEEFATEFMADWDINNANVTITGTTVSNSDLTSDNFTVTGTCIWLGDPAQADCSSISTFTDTCLGDPGITIERAHHFEFSNNDPQGNELQIENPTSSRIRRRKFDIDTSPLPARVDTLNITITDTALDGSYIGSECGKGVLILNSGTTGGKFKLEKIHYDLDVPNELPEWFVNNQWHHLIYAAISAEMIPGTGGSCISAHNCLTLNGDNPSDDNEAIVVISGAELDSINQDRAGAVTPPVDITDYFELENKMDGNDDVFEYWKNNSDFNDQVKVISDN